MSNVADVVAPQESRALKVSRRFALIAFGALAAILVVVLLARLLPATTPTFAMTEEVALARLQAAYPLIADDRLGAPITAEGQTYYPVAYNNGDPGEELRIYVSNDQVAKMQIRFNSHVAVVTAHGQAVVPLLKAAEPALSDQQLLGAASSVDRLIQGGERASVMVGEERVVVAAGGMDIVLTVMPSAAPDPLNKHQ